MVQLGREVKGDRLPDDSTPCTPQAACWAPEGLWGLNITLLCTQTHWKVILLVVTKGPSCVTLPAGLGIHTH